MPVVYRCHTRYAIILLAPLYLRLTLHSLPHTGVACSFPTYSSSPCHLAVPLRFTRSITFLVKVFRFPGAS